MTLLLGLLCGMLVGGAALGYVIVRLRPPGRAVDGPTGLTVARSLVARHAPGTEVRVLRGGTPGLVEHFGAVKPRPYIALSAAVAKRRLAPADAAVRALIAHEVGHAADHRDGSWWLRVRSSVAMPVTYLGALLTLILLPFTAVLGDAPFYAYCLSGAGFALALPSEVHASCRALAMLPSADQARARAFLAAAFLSYAVAPVTAPASLMMAWAGSLLGLDHQPTRAATALAASDWRTTAVLGAMLLVILLMASPSTTTIAELETLLQPLRPSTRP